MTEKPSGAFVTGCRLERGVLVAQSVEHWFGGEKLVPALSGDCFGGGSHAINVLFPPPRRET
jgi:hypothetical protein